LFDDGDDEGEDEEDCVSADMALVSLNMVLIPHGEGGERERHVPPGPL